MDYNHKLKLNDKIKRITDNTIYHKIYNIIKKELYEDNGKKKYSYNNNGIFFDMNILSDKSLLEIDTIVNQYILTETDSDIRI